MNPLVAGYVFDQTTASRWTGTVKLYDAAAYILMRNMSKKEEIVSRIGRGKKKLKKQKKKPKNSNKKDRRQ